MIGIYKITCIANGKVYIGSSNNISKRIKEHYNNLRKQKHINIYFQRLWNKYGENTFIAEVIITCIEEYRFKLEQWFLTNTSNKINLSETVVVNEGQPLKESTKKKISDKLKQINPPHRDAHIRAVGTLNGAKNGMAVARKVKVTLDGVESIYDSVTECANKTGISRSGITGILNNYGANRGSRIKYKFSYV